MEMWLPSAPESFSATLPPSNQSQPFYNLLIPSLGASQHTELGQEHWTQPTLSPTTPVLRPPVSPSGVGTDLRAQPPTSPGTHLSPARCAPSARAPCSTWPRPCGRCAPRGYWGTARSLWGESSSDDPTLAGSAKARCIPVTHTALPMPRVQRAQEGAILMLGSAANGAWQKGQSPKPHSSNPLCPIPRALLGGMGWDGCGCLAPAGPILPCTAAPSQKALFVLSHIPHTWPGNAIGHESPALLRSLPLQWD